MIHLDANVSYHAKDIIQKYASSLFRDSTLAFYGIKTARIKELINADLPIIEVADSYADFVFLLEDDSYLHYEFQSQYNKGDLIRFAGYDLRLYERDERFVHTVIIYSADVMKTPPDLDVGSLRFSPSIILMNNYNGDDIVSELEAKAFSGSELSDTDILNLLFLPLMRNTAPRSELAANTIKIARTIPDTTKRNACIAAAFAFASRYLDRSEAEELLREGTDMVDLVGILIEREVEKGVSAAVEQALLAAVEEALPAAIEEALPAAIEEALPAAIEEALEDNSIEIAKRAILEGLETASISRITGLGESVISQLKTEMRKLMC